MEYFKDYYVGNKYIGSRVCKTKDRQVFGFMGRLTAQVYKQIILDNGKKIKAGSTVTTELQILCGRK